MPLSWDRLTDADVKLISLKVINSALQIQLSAKY